MNNLRAELAKHAAIAVVLGRFYMDLFAYHQGSQVISRYGTKGLLPLWSVNTCQANFVLGIVMAQNLDGVPVCDRYNAPCDVSMGIQCKDYAKRN
jgi:hypothetical protein